MKRIKQLGTANFVYPGANHSRFEHSIGTMHVTSLILNRLEKCDKEEELAIRLAALLHDIGHGPFSHTFEEILDRNPKFVSNFNGLEMRDHEDFSLQILLHDIGLKRILGSNREEIINFLFEGKPIGVIPSELVTGDIGSDRMDYLLRDTYYTGLGHRPDINSLISNLQISVMEKKHPRLTLKPEGTLSAELLITTRYYHYSMIVHNPKTRSIELLFLRMLENFLKKNSDPKKYMLEAFTKFDDNTILRDLSIFGGSLVYLFYSGKGFHPIYSMNLRQIRSGLTKYCIYRFFFDKIGLMNYVRLVGTELKKALAFNDIIFDVHLFKCSVPDIILYAARYATEKEWISPLLIDHSDILQLVPSEQLLRSVLWVMSKQDISESEHKRLSHDVEAKRGLFLTRDVLVPITRKSIATNGFQLIDEFYTFLCSLRDFYNENPWKKDIPECSKEELFRGVGRLYRLVDTCKKKIGKPRLNFQIFFEEKSKTFQYSTQIFSILSALARMKILRFEYTPASRKSDGKPFHSTYMIRPVESVIRKSVYDGLSEFDSLRLEFSRMFRSLGWDEYFANFFPLKEER